MPRRRDLETLRNLRLFSACSNRELEQIARLTDEITVEADQYVVRQDAAGREAFVIVEGTASVLVGEEEILQLGPGQHFGELALLDGGPRAASVKSLTPMTLLVIHRPAFMGLLDEHPAISRRIMATMATMIRDLQGPGVD